MRYRVIREYDRRYPIRLMCRALAGSAHAWGRDSGEDRDEVACHHPVPASVPGGREYPGSDLHCRGAQSGVGRGLDLRLDAGGLALSGRPAGSVLTPSGRMGHGTAVNCCFGPAGPHDGVDEPNSHGRAPAPLGPRQSVCRYQLSAFA